jgi:hypothetical protein
MPGSTVYLDASVPSYWLEQGLNPTLQDRHLATRVWWERELPRFAVFISQVVLDELAGGDPERAARRLGLVRNFALLAVDEAVTNLAQFYMDNLVMPSRNPRDAFHLALASTFAVDYLVTWNFEHLANASKRRHIEILNRRRNLSVPVICSPEELTLDAEEQAGV